MSTKIKLQIKSIFGYLLFEYEKENNTIKDTVEEAIRCSADLRYADLRYADLRSADLSYANLSSANLRYADLRYADLRSADLSYANLSSANLRYANLSSANLRSAKLSYAKLSYAKLSYAKLSYAKLSYAKLSYADLSCLIANEGTTMFFSQCPDGEFVGWKKANGKIVKLLVLEDAKRSSATTLKCRCSKARVLEIQEVDGSKSDLNEVNSNYDSSFIYRVGDVVSVDNFDDNRWDACSTGIHFFISRDMAVLYD